MKKNLKWTLITGAAVIIIAIIGIIILENRNAFKQTNKTTDSSIKEPANEPASVYPSAAFLPGTMFSPDGMTLAANTYVYDSAKADIDGDRATDDVVLYGEKQENDNPYVQNIGIAVKDGQTGIFSAASIGESNVGLEPKLFIGNFTYDKNKGILVSIATGGSGGIYQFALMTYIDEQVTPVVSQKELNEGLVLETQVLTNYALKLTDKNSGYSILLDLHKGAEIYQSLGIYNEQGQLLEDPMVLVDGYGVLKPKDENGDGIYELHGLQSISVAVHVNGVATAESVWTVNNGHLKLLSEKIIPIDQ